MSSQTTAPAGYLDIYNRSGRLLQRLALRPGRRYLLGRGYGCDLLIDDPYLCAEHAELRVDAAGAVTVSDLGSRNGLRDEAGNRVSSLELDDRQKLHLGHSQLQFHAASQALAESLPLEDGYNLFALFDGGLRMWLAVLAALAVIVIDGLLDQSVELTASALISGFSVVAALLLFWAAIWAVIGRLVAQRFRYRNHLAIALVGLATLTVLLTLAAYSAFALGLDGWLPVFNSTAILGSLAVMLVTHLHFATGIAGRRLMVWVAAIGLPLCAIFGAAIWLDEDEFSPIPEFTATLKLPTLALRPAVSIDDFMNAADQQIASESDAQQDGS